MRSHLTTLLKKKTGHPVQLGDTNRTESDSSSTQSENEQRPREENPVGYYGLRENPKKSVKTSDPEFLDAGSVVQDRESETESTQYLTRRRSTKRPSQTPRVSGSQTNGFEPKKLKRGGVKSESATESTPVSSVSDPSQDEEVALCLMMLSRDVWIGENNSAVLKTRSTRSTRTARFMCLACKKKFKTNRALVGHKASSKECQQQETHGEDHKIYECPFCYKVFGSGQALGGHKRSHLLGSSSTNTNLASNHDVDGDNNNCNASNDVVFDKVGDTTSFILDLNLPAPIEDNEES